MKEVYQQTKQELFEIYGSPLGHTEEEAKALLQKYGENVLEGKGKKSVLRVFMAYKKLNKPVEIEKPDIKEFHRRGFTVVEWGGTEVK